MTISRQTLFGKLNRPLFKGLESATVFCKLRGNPHVEIAHWMHQLMQGQDNDLARIARQCKLDQAALDRDMTQMLIALPAGASSINDFSAFLIDAVERAWVYATLGFGDNRIRGGYLLAALITTPDLRQHLLGISPQFRLIPVDDCIDLLPAWTDGSPEAFEPASDGTHIDMSGTLSDTDDAPGIPGEASQATSPFGSAPAGKSSLARFCTDLTERARSGQIDPVIGRELEIRAIIDILLRRRQNNPLLTGDAGVGKTAIVEGLALALARGDVPPLLREVRLLGLDVGSLLAGASMKGEFESRLRALIEEAGRSSRPVVLFVDEVHTLVGAGGSQGTGDAANLLKPALARGTLRTIGATTWSEYKKHIEKDPALTRRFQLLQVQEPDEATGVEMVRGLVPTFEAHHKVMILNEAVSAAVRLSARYIPSRQLPDKAISLLDTACARVALSLSAPPPEVEHARRCLAAIDAETALLQKECAVLSAEHPGVQRLAALHEERQAAQAELESVEARWNAELPVVLQLLEQRAQILALVAEPQTPRDTAHLWALEQKISTIQKNGALVYPEVNSAVVASIVADWTGIPVGRMLRDDLNVVLELPDLLGRRIIGQPHALSALGRRIQTARAQLTDPNKPVGVFLLVGPSGVGKTETALTLAEALYGGEQNLITVNMSEFQEAHTVSTLKGAPPGYVGYGEGGVLTEAVRRRPHSVILLDEIEKAHQDVYEIFYQVFDKGWMEDGEGRYIDFKNTVILLTTNVGAELTASLCNDPAFAPEAGALADALMPELRKVFPAAFLGRLTVLPYYPLGEAQLSRIVDLHLERIADRLFRNHGIRMTCDEAVKAHVVASCDVAETGARLMIAFIEQHILPEISRLWLDLMQAGSTVEQIRITVMDGNIFCEKSSK